MENLLHNLNSVEVSYGDNALTTIIQIEERITEIAEFLASNDTFTNFERTEVRDRLAKLVEVNNMIQLELTKQGKKLSDIQDKLMETKLAI